MPSITHVCILNLFKVAGWDCPNKLHHHGFLNALLASACEFTTDGEKIQVDK